jgi:hypothetical protein
MAHPAYVQAKARELRVQRRLSVDEIAERLALPRTTIYSWVSHLPLERARRNSPHPGNAAACRKWRRLREDAYAEGLRIFRELAEDPSFRDFVCLYVAEGYKRDRNTVAICNSDPAVMRLSHRWITGMTSNLMDYRFQYHADQDPRELAEFWAGELGIDAGRIRAQRKSNSNQLAKRTWRSEHGVLTVRVGDTLLHARLQAWMKCLRDTWLDSTRSGA